MEDSIDGVNLWSFLDRTTKMTEKKDWIARAVERTPEQREAMRAARDRRYAHLMNKPRDWVADPTKNHPAAG